MDFAYIILILLLLIVCIALVRASLAQPIGENPGRDANGNDSDNTKNRIRLWFQAVKFM